jgi:putative tricarboxylic transport membrane protein
MSAIPGSWKPQHEIELVAGTPPGGGQDRPARALMKLFAEERLIDVPIRVSNIVGKGGGAAWDHLRAHPGDPHVLAINSAPLLTNRLIGVSDYDHRDLTPIANLYTEYVVFAARADSSIRDAQNLQRRLGAAPGSITIALATALGVTNHIAAARIAMLGGGDPKKLALHVFDSARFAVADVVAGKAEVAAVTAVSAAPEITEGKLRTLAATAPERLPGIFAATPTFAECGIDCVRGTWRGVIAPEGLSAAQIAFWEQTLSRAIATSQWQAELASQYWLASYLDSASCTAFLDQDKAELRDELGALGLLTSAS